MTKKPELKVIELEPARDITPNEQVIVMLERALEAAREGKIRSIAMAAVEGDGSITTYYPHGVHETCYLHTLASAIARLQHRYQREAYDAAFSVHTTE